MPECLFCKIASGEIPTDKVFEDYDVIAFNDINPQAPTHVLIIPRKHIATTNDIDLEDEAILGKLISTAAKIAKDRGIDSSGYRIVMNCNADAGQMVFHIHLHLLGGRKMSWPPG